MSQTWIALPSLLPGKADEIPDGAFAVAFNYAHLSPEQLLYSLAQATGVLQKQIADAEQKLSKADVDKKRLDPLWRAQVLRAGFGKQTSARWLANTFGMRKGEPEVEFQASMAGALYLANDRTLLTWLKADVKKMNFLARLQTVPSADAVAEELYLTVLSRLPNGGGESGGGRSSEAARGAAVRGAAGTGVGADRVDGVSAESLTGGSLFLAHSR